MYLLAGADLSTGHAEPTCNRSNSIALLPPVGHQAVHVCQAFVSPSTSVVTLSGGAVLKRGTSNAARALMEQRRSNDTFRVSKVLLHAIQTVSLTRMSASLR